MIKIEHVEKLDKTLIKLLDDQFNQFAIENNVSCNYAPFNFIATENGEVVGLLTGYTIYAEVRIANIVVNPSFRGRGIGTKLVAEVENRFKDKNLKNINLSTYEFQAPEFYKKCGYKLEFIRENKDNPKLSKYFFVKFF